MPSKIDRAYFRLRAEQNEYRAKEWDLFAFLDRRLIDVCYASWSAGKDSTVVAHACHQMRPGIAVLMIDPGVPIHWTEEDKIRMKTYAMAIGWNFQIFAWEKFGAERSDNEAEYRKQIHNTMFAPLESYADTRALTRRVTGMRAAESKARHKFLTATRGVTKNTLQPLWDWSTEDVWTYTVKHELPWLSIYDHMGPDARNGLIGKNGREHGRMAFLKLHYPEAFREACEIFNARDFA